MGDEPGSNAREALANAWSCALYLVALILFAALALAWLLAPAAVLGRYLPWWFAYPAGLVVSGALFWWVASTIVRKGGIGGSNPLRRPPGRRAAPPPGKSGAPPTSSMRGPLARRGLDDEP